MPDLLNDVRCRIQQLEERRRVLRTTAERCVTMVHVRHLTGRDAAALIAESSIANAHAQCLTVEIYALRAMVGVSAYDARS